MANPFPLIDSSYEQFYAKRVGFRGYPTEFVVRIFLDELPRSEVPRASGLRSCARYRLWRWSKNRFLLQSRLRGDRYRDHGKHRPTDWRAVGKRLAELGHQADLRVGRNSHIPFGDGYFDHVLACHCCYYCDEGDTFADNMKEYARVMKPGAWLVASVASRSSYIFKDAVALEDGSLRIQADPHGNRDGYRLHAFSSKAQIETYLSPWFERFSFGFADNDYYGVSERLFWVVCQKR